LKGTPAVLALGLASPLAAQVPAPGNGVAASVVHVQVFRSAFDWSQPWRQEGVTAASGSGFFIAGGRILTNAHVIADARQILVRRPDQANPYVATVEAVGNDCDLAVLRVADPEFAKGLRPLALGSLPRPWARTAASWASPSRASRARTTWASSSPSPSSGTS
jgi:S1-C subfamily serine protease